MPPAVRTRTMWPPQGLRRGGSFMTVPCRLSSILATTEAQRLIVVTHSGVCTVAGLRALGFDCTGKRTFESYNCGIHTIAVQGETWRAVALNDVTHLTSTS